MGDVYLIGLTGGIASGKSTIAGRLAEHGAVVVDADRLAREAVEPGTQALVDIRDAFGVDIISADGSLDRPALGSIVFGDPQRLARLNAIVHPAVRRLFEQRVADAAALDPAAVVIYDVPLLAEGGLRDEFDLVVVAHAPRETRINRLVTLRGLAQPDAERRVAAQASDEDRLAIADRVIDTGGTMEHTIAQADALWDSLPDR